MNSELREPSDQRPTSISKAHLQHHRMHIPLSFEKIIELSSKVGELTACDNQAAVGWIDNVTGRLWFDDSHLHELLKKMFVLGSFWRTFLQLFHRIIDSGNQDMRSCSSAALVFGALIVGCGVVAGHQNHGHGGKQIPLHEREYVQDPVEELERKWNFEVSSVSLYCILHSRALTGSSRKECLFP